MIKQGLLWGGSFEPLKRVHLQGLVKPKNLAESFCKRCRPKNEQIESSDADDNLRHLTATWEPNFRRKCGLESRGCTKQFGTQNPELRITKHCLKLHPTATLVFATGCKERVLSRTMYEIKKDSHKDYPFLFGAPPGTRTLDPLIKSQLLYQLS